MKNKNSKQIKKSKPKNKTHKHFSVFPAYSDKLLVFAVLILVIYSSIMVASAAMGEGAGDTGVVTRTLQRQGVFALFGIIGMAIASRTDWLFKCHMRVFYLMYGIVVFLLMICRLWTATYGAYGWIRIGSISIQPSEFAKVFMIIFAARLFKIDRHELNLKYAKIYIICSLVLFVIILGLQKDLGSAVVLLGMCFIMLLIVPYKELNKIRKIMLALIAFVIVGVVIIFLPGVNSFLEEHSSSYQIGRFLAANNPFKYQYDVGYHLIMGLVSFATGGWFGVGYGQSIHKYMNFPNPTTDFILPVIVEEMGIVGGFLPIMALYAIIFFKLVRYSIKANEMTGKIILSGTFAYFFIHFVLNIGGVSGLIPLTGVPLLFVSSGGSSLVASMTAIGFCEEEIIKYRRSNVI